MYYVYIHTFPNGKVYVGETKSPQSRWANGDGYKENKEMYAAIQKFGWNNIKHEIIAEYDNEIEARVCEAVIICHLNAESSNCGYNKTGIKNDSLKKYVSRRPLCNIDIESCDTDKSIFENSGLPVSVCAEIISQWIFNEKHRNIVYDRLINGLTFPELSKKHGLSMRQAKQIVKDCIITLSDHV